MSVEFDYVQDRNLNQPNADRIQQFESHKKHHRPLVDMANPAEARCSGGMSQASRKNGELALPQTGQLHCDDPYSSTVGNGSAQNFLADMQQMERQLVNFEKELSNLDSILQGYIASEASAKASTTPPMDTQPATTAEIASTTLPIDTHPNATTNNGASENQNIPPLKIPPTDTKSTGGVKAAPAGNNDSASNTSKTTSLENTTTPVTTNTNTKSGTTTTENGSGFQVNNGKLTYNGKSLAGVNVTSDYFRTKGAQAVADQVSSDFPGINVVRLETSPSGGPYSMDGGTPQGESTSDIQADIQALNAKGIGVIVDNHAGDANNSNNVSQDGNEAQWFSTLAKQNMGNNNVMFQTENEPTGSNQAIVNEQVAAYNAIRATGSNNVVAFDLEGGYMAKPQLSDPSAYDSMSNYVIDAHIYVSDSQPLTDLKNEAAQIAPLKEANGQAVPVYFGETGNSVDGKDISSAANQLLQTEFTDGNGAVAFAFDHDVFGNSGSSQADNMTDPNGNLNAYGQFIASLIKQSNS